MYSFHFISLRMKLKVKAIICGSIHVSRFIIKVLSTTPVCVALFLNDNRIIPVVVVKEHFMVP